MPFLRTFAPFVAGVAEMTRSRFTLYDVSGGALWVGSLTLAGYLFGNIPWVKENLDKIIWGAILIPGLLVLIGAWRARMKQAKTALDLARRARRRIGDRRGRLWRRVRRARRELGLRARRAGLLLVDGAAAIDALEELRPAEAPAHGPASKRADQKSELRRGSGLIGQAPAGPATRVARRPFPDASGASGRACSCRRRSA